MLINHKHNTLDSAYNALFDFLFSLEQALPALLQEYGLWLYVIIFLIIFFETGCIFMAFLPGDSLLISIGALCATVGSEHLVYMILVLFFLQHWAISSITIPGYILVHVF
jgi:hypothetical protein